MYTDADLAAAIERGIVVGPRLLVSTRGIAPTGGYLPDDIAWDAHIATGAQLVDGIDEIRKAVREQVRFGAAWIKVYADFGGYPGTKPDRPFRSRPNFRDDELRAIVEEAHRLGKKVAMHATGWDGIDAALRAGADSIEHGFGLTDELAQRMAKQGVALVPTVQALRYRAKLLKNPPPLIKVIEWQKVSLKRAAAAGVSIVNGSDAGSFPFSDSPVQELTLLTECGLTRLQALRAATSAAGVLLSELCAPDQKNCMRDKIGVIAPEAFADMIAVDGNPLEDLKALGKLKLVMKAGAVFPL
jgi:imidazolonepropionase-like amidohydrolase